MSGQQRQMRLTFFLIGVGIVVLGLGVATLQTGGFIQDSHLEVFPIALMIGSWVPFLLYLALMRTPAATVLTGWALVIATLFLYGVAFTSPHSTAPLGFLASPILNLIIALGGLMLDVILRRQSHRASYLPATGRDLS